MSHATGQGICPRCGMLLDLLGSAALTPPVPIPHQLPLIGALKCMYIWAPWSPGTCTLDST